MKIGLYIHIPFCFSKCPYCDFFSIATYNKQLKSVYLSALKNEMMIYSYHFPQIEVQSIYLGGGTPSTLSGSQISHLIHYCHQQFKINENIEITIESNPASFDLQKAQTIYRSGIDRLSLGIQSFDDAVLKTIGRIHNSQDALKAYEIARKAGFKNINVDLMFGLPNQSLDLFQRSLVKAVHLNPDHISIYALSIAPNTPYGKLLQKGKLNLPSDNVEYNMYKSAICYLTDNGFEQYEISNFAKPNKQCWHNKIYWKNKSYLGIGAGATSYIEGNRFTNFNDLLHYLSFLSYHILPIKTSENLSPRQEMAETVILGLRMMDGISNQSFYDRYKIPLETIFNKQLKHLCQQGLLHYDNQYYYLSKKGIYLANNVFMEFLE